jgi:tetratricopeptide (TPR) repeat protein
MRVAARELNRALRLFKGEKNQSGQVAVLTALSELAIRRRYYREALDCISQAKIVLHSDEDPRHEISIKLLEGQALAGLGRKAEAMHVLKYAERLAKKRQQTDSLRSIRNELGKISVCSGDTRSARSYFEKAVRDTEGLRASVGADEFSVAFLGARTEPTDNLTRLLLSEGKIAEAFRTVERGRSRSLLDAMERGHGRVPAALKRQLDEARSRLNSLYRSIDRGESSDTARSAEALRDAEAELANLIRRANALTASSRGTAHSFDLRGLMNELGTGHILVEYVEIDGALSAFVVDAKKVRYVASLGHTTEVGGLIEELHFQFETLRYGGHAVSRFAGQMKERADVLLMRLYDILIRPLEKHLTAKRLVFVPAGPVHYVPMHALHDGTAYLIERYETAYAPASAVWSKLWARSSRRPRSPLVIGFADERIPQAEHEAAEVHEALPHSDLLTGTDATFEAFIANAGSHDLIHLACHGQFRPDNPMFSSLHLADGWVTVQDICSRRIKASLVTLSACETGISKIAAGDEPLGLVRGFLAAGAASLVVSLWTVNDAAARELMLLFYENLQRGAGVSASLRDAQMALVTRGEHPFLWSPFISIGR